MQNEVQTSIKIATEAKECADIQKKEKLKHGNISSFASVAGKAVSMLGV